MIQRVQSYRTIIAFIGIPYNNSCTHEIPFHAMLTHIQLGFLVGCVRVLLFRLILTGQKNSAGEVGSGSGDAKHLQEA